MPLIIKHIECPVQNSFLIKNIISDEKLFCTVIVQLCVAHLDSFNIDKIAFPLFP